MWFSYQLPSTLLTFLDEVEIGTLSYVSKQLYEDTHVERTARKRKIISHVLHYFHHPFAVMFSLHRTFQDDFLINIKRLFHFIPEWFDYLKEHNIQYLDLSLMEPRTYASISLRRIIPESDIPMRIQSILDHVSRNTTLLYCNFNLFRDIITQDQVYEAVQHHPKIDQVEITMSLGYYSPTCPMSLYRVSDGRLEWRQYPPSN
jgi:hypothetical protein